MDDDKSQNYSFDVPVQVPKASRLLWNQESDVPV